MSVKAWALRPTEVKALSRAAMLRLAARCAMRVEPWTPPGAAAPWKRGLAHVCRVASTAPAGDAQLARELQDLGARACNRLDATDEPLGRSINYAGLALALALEASALDVGPALTKTVIDGAKYAASIAAVLAHAGRVRVAGGKDPVEVACTTMWDAIRADIPVVAAAPARLDARGVRALAPLWPRRTPAWAS